MLDVLLFLLLMLCFAGQMAQTQLLNVMQDRIQFLEEQNRKHHD